MAKWPLSLGDGMKNIGSCVRKLCFLTLIKRSNLLYPIPAKLRTVSLSGISFVCTRYSTEAQRRIYKTIAIPAIGRDDKLFYLLFLEAHVVSDLHPSGPLATHVPSDDLRTLRFCCLKPKKNGGKSGE